MDVALRPCCASDSALILGWRNSADARKFSKSQKIISPREHDEWIIDRIARISEAPFWIITCNALPIGYVRFDLNSSIAINFEVSIYLSLDFRFSGLGKHSLALALNNLIRDFPGSSVVAKVHNQNAASIKLFKNANFQLCETSDAFQIFLLNLE
jgi:RimJ/RimL family protein N-acetyltransferase